MAIDDVLPSACRHGLSPWGSIEQVILQQFTRIDASDKNFLTLLFFRVSYGGRASISHVIKGGVKGGYISKNFLDLNIVFW